MNISITNGKTLEGIQKINVLIGKNGSGKSTLLKEVETAGQTDSGEWGNRRYITPERGGVLTYESNVEQQINTNPAHMSSSRRANQYNQFRQQSIAQYRKLEISVLREYGRKQTGNFQDYIDQINNLLDNLEIRIPENDTDMNFKIFSKTTNTLVAPTIISSGESELISLAIECLVFSREIVPGKINLLCLDEPDVHLHPDLQTRLIEMLRVLVEKSNFTILIATHSTAILGAISDDNDATVAFMKSGDQTIRFNNIDEVCRKVLPVFGAHPLSNVFNNTPMLLVEGDDDVWIWQQAIKSSEGKIKAYPISCDGISNIGTFEVEVKKIIDSIYDEARGYSLRDRDDSTNEIDDMPSIVRLKLGCRAAENLLLTDQVLSSCSMNWSDAEARMNNWIDNNAGHPKFQAMKSFRESSYDRKTHDLKEIRMIIVGDILASNKPWEVLVGQTIGSLKRSRSTRYSVANSMFNFLGRKTSEALFPLR